ncbi:hypothetical protein BGZ58_002492, partial [Dissophora ornata]
SRTMKITASVLALLVLATTVLAGEPTNPKTEMNQPDIKDGGRCRDRCYRDYNPYDHCRGDGGHGGDGGDGSRDGGKDGPNPDWGRCYDEWERRLEYCYDQCYRRH